MENNRQIVQPTKNKKTKQTETGRIEMRNGQERRRQTN